MLALLKFNMTNRPNILLITTDQQHANTIHALGNAVIQTPNLDRLVKEGAAFDRAYCANPVCSPSRSSILTGQYPSSHGCWNIGVALPEDNITLSQVLSEQGYRTGLFGKAHFQPVLSEGGFESPPNIFNRDFWRNWNGPYYGFDEVQMVHGHAGEISSHGMHFGVWLEDQGVDTSKYFGPRGTHREGSWDLPEEYHYTRWTADQTISFLESGDTEQSAEDPFFAWCSFQDPHDSYLAPEPWASKYDPGQIPAFHKKEGEMSDKTLLHQCAIKNEWGALDINPTGDPFDTDKVVQCLGWTTDEIGEQRAKQWVATYYGMVSLVDYHVGRILDTLNNQQLSENTIVIFTTDHGDYLGNHGIWLKGPLHYEDVIRLPFLVRWSNEIPGGMRSGSLMSLVDIAPTLLDICDMQDAMPCQGVSQRNAWLNPHHAARDWCLVENRAEDNIYVKTLVREKYKLNVHLHSGEGELYDLENDPHEFHNLYQNNDYTTIANRLLQQLLKIDADLEGPYPPRQSFA